ncbi:SLAM family member 5-like isoform X2 [Pseudorasbora parva]
MEGESVTLQINVTELQRDDEILWTFGTKGPLIAKTNGVNNYFPDDLDGRFRDRLELDQKTGSLTITNTSTELSGVYEAEISRSNSSPKHRFNVTFYARLPIPVIISKFSNCSSSSSSSSCSLLCSVVNVSHVTLSWFKGNSLLSNFSMSDLSISLSLPLEIECLDDSYSCVVAYSFSNQTSHLNTELCQTCPDCAFCCHVSEAVIRLVVSALVGVAAACIVTYDITSRKVDQDRA